MDVQKEPIKQNAPALYEPIQKIGCFFRAALRMAEFEAETQGSLVPYLNKTQINLLWLFAHDAGYINAQDEVLQSAPIANLALDYLGITGKFTEVAVFQNGTMGWYKSVQNRRADYFIQKHKQAGPSGTHFVNVDKAGRVVFDPHEPAIKSTGVLYTICYRYDA